MVSNLMFSKMLFNICLVFFKFFTCIGSSLVFYAWGLIIFPKVTCLFQNDYRAVVVFVFVCLFLFLYVWLSIYVYPSACLALNIDNIIFCRSAAVGFAVEN